MNIVIFLCDFMGKGGGGVMALIISSCRSFNISPIKKGESAFCACDTISADAQNRRHFHVVGNVRHSFILTSGAFLFSICVSFPVKVYGHVHIMYGQQVILHVTV